MSAEKRLANFLGWFSLGLGVPQVLMPGRFARLIGAGDDRNARFWTRIVGLREHAAAAGILSRPRPVGSLTARVAGDTMDLALLGVAMRRKGANRRRLAGAITAVAGVIAADALATAAMARRGRDEEGEQGPLHVKAAITVRRSPEDVQRSWLDMHGGDGMGAVRFVPAPGGRGTEIHVDAESDVPGDAVGETAAKLFGGATDQRVKDELRRFKQLLEAGEIVRSDASPEGVSAARQIKQRPAQPPAEIGASEGSAS